MIGKGDRDDKVVEAIKAKGAVYFGATGGTGALLSGRIASSEIAAFPELGTEAIRRIEVVDFPVIVLIDPSGTDIYRTNVIKYRNIREEAD
jgi:fumarate hydratase subunit beta